ncbi:unnamed protein product [Heligmosomoides polygyrus]|uniref:Endo/exonuclease/phosphatase domain-containing protein n=1 Tax=Heligmosomoides polygyrus TaxID=6339 RepID=A0A183FR08_HELPZ|nr:unnamed protein product [Heligmosomoides polygyrus]
MLRARQDFYLSLEEAIRSVPEGDYLSIAGDMNGHVGSGRRGVERVHGEGGSGGRKTEVDHILVRRAALKTVRDVKVIPEEDVASQHIPLVADLSIPLPTRPKVMTEPGSDGGDCGVQSGTSYEGQCSKQAFQIQLVP